VPALGDEIWKEAAAVWGEEGSSGIIDPMEEEEEDIVVVGFFRKSKKRAKWLGKEKCQRKKESEG
jgi:hypothetical protein